MDRQAAPMVMKRIVSCAALVAIASCSVSAHANAQLALDKGCYSCHGTPPKKGVPTFGQIAADYARYRDTPSAEIQLAEKLRQGHLFGGVQAHQRLSEETARALVRWLISGGH